MYKVVSNYRLVLDDRLLETSKKILRLLFDNNLHANEIIRQTSSDRSYIFSTIKMLEREGLIIRNTRTKRGKKMVTQLTEVGHELADILLSLEQYKKSYFELRKACEEKLNIHNYLHDPGMAKNPIVRRILRNKGLLMKK